MAMTFYRGKWNLKSKAARCFKAGEIARSMEAAAMDVRYGVEGNELLKTVSGLGIVQKRTEDWEHLYPGQEKELREIGKKAKNIEKRFKKQKQTKKWTPKRRKLLKDANDLWNRTMQFTAKAGKTCGARFKRG